MSNWRNIKELINRKRFVIFGTGFFSELWYYRLLAIGFKPLYFTDNNSAIWEKEIVDGIICIPPKNIKDRADDIICLVCVRKELWNEINIQLELYDLDYICMNEEITQEYEFICDYFNTKLDLYSINDEPKRLMSKYTENSRIAVYTAIFGDYDNLIQPLEIDRRCDYYCISVNEPENLGVYKWIPFDSICVNKLESYTLKNRYCKFFPNKLFPQYDYSIYIDGNIKINSTLSHLVDQMGEQNFGLFEHPDCNDLYVEAFRFSEQYFDIDFSNAIKKQVEEYAGLGFPFGFGFVENSIIVRKHNEQESIQIMETWWDEYIKYKTRDQLSFMYSFWKCGLSKDDIVVLGKDWRKTREFSHIPHKYEHIRKHLSFDKNK